ncbi:MAG: hypothetical protein IJR50_07775 [Treponema sp.]|nr:hypothetical protein [Treponema sp.]
MPENNFVNNEIEEEKKRHAELRKKSEQKRNTVIFMLCVSIVEVALMLAFMVAFYILAAVVIYRVFNAQSAVPMQIMSPLAFIGGVVVGFILHKKIMCFFINILHLQNKLQDGIADHYLSRKAWMKKHGRR